MILVGYIRITVWHICVRRRYCISISTMIWDINRNWWWRLVIPIHLWVGWRSIEVLMLSTLVSSNVCQIIQTIWDSLICIFQNFHELCGLQLDIHIITRHEKLTLFPFFLLKNVYETPDFPLLPVLPIL